STKEIGPIPVKVTSKKASENSFALTWEDVKEIDPEKRTCTDDQCELITVGKKEVRFGNKKFTINLNDKKKIKPNLVYFAGVVGVIFDAISNSSKAFGGVTDAKNGVPQA
ncbi:8147_t:CDS:2, partial [Scutellospora calospora]